MQWLGGCGWLKGKTTRRCNLHRGWGWQGGHGCKGLFETVLMYMYLAAYLAMPLSIISCYLGEVL